MEFLGNIQFADEGSWLTLTTDSDETVTITVTLISPQETSEVLSFNVTPNSGLVRLPAGEILLALTGGGCRMIIGYFKATQGDSSCTKNFSVLPCREFAYKAIEATIFTARPSKTPVYPGAEDRLYFFLVSGTPYAYVRFRYRNGGVSTPFSLSPTYNSSTRCYEIDASCDTMLSYPVANGRDITGYDIWVENSGEKSETYSFDIKRTLLPLKTYKFLGPRGTYEYIHATGAFSRSVESETQVFVTDGTERELDNDSSMIFEQNSGHIGSAGMAGFWLQLLASKERHIVEKDGSERLIIVDEHKASISDRQVGSLTFKWHYANPNNTIVEKVDVALTGLTVTGPSSVNNVNNEADFSVTYSPSDTTQRGVSWSIVSGSDYASIDASGKLTVKNGANGNTVTVRATSAADSSIYADKSVTVTYRLVAEASWNLPSSYTYDKDGTGYPTVQITDTDSAGWTLSMPDWIVTEGGITSGTGSFSLMLPAEANAGAVRSGEIILKTADGKRTLARCAVTQEAAAGLDVDPSWDLPSSYTYDKEGNNTPTALITDEDNAGWMLSYPDWIVAEGGMTSGSGSFSLMLSAYSNTGAARSGEILLKSADGKKTFGRCVVTQEGAASGGTLSVSPETLTGEYMGLRGTDLGSVIVTTDQSWTAELGGLLQHVAISPSSGTGDAVIKLTEIYGASFEESGTLTVTAADGKTAAVRITIKY